MNLALFTDATSHPGLRKSAVGVVGFDVTNPIRPTELLRYATAIPFCEPTTAEKISVLRGLEQVLALLREGKTPAESLLVFNDSTSVVYSPQITQSSVACRIKSLGCSVAFQHAPRRLNRVAHLATHDAIYTPNPNALLPLPFDPAHAPLMERFPFLQIVNE
jgi:hypothetical protein